MIIPPLRITFTGISSFTLFRISNSLLALYSFTNARTVASKIAIIIPIPSSHSPLKIPTQIETTAAIIKMRITGSSNLLKNSFHHGLRAGGVNKFVPN